MEKQDRKTLYYLWLILEAIQQNDIQAPPVEDRTKIKAETAQVS
jgi:hypothetical protein